MIYLDYNATAPIDPEVAEAMWDVHRQGLGNPSSPHAAGRRARRLLEDAREEILALVGARPDADRLIFTSGGTEANNLAIRGLLPAGGTLVVSSIEHPSVREPAQRLARRGTSVQWLPVDEKGVARVEAIEPWLAGGGLLSVMLANNETGVIQPVAELAERSRAAGFLCHTDAVQALGKVDFGFRDLDVDAMSISCHKIHGPVGIGALVCRAGVAPDPLLQGGSQQFGLRPGTESVALAVGMCQAIRRWEATRRERIERLAALRDRFEARLRAADPDLVINGMGANRLPNTSNVSFPGCDRQALLMALDMQGIACSTGAACSSGSSEPSAVLKAMGAAPAVIEGALRLSFGTGNTPAEVDLAADRIIQAAKQLRDPTQGLAKRPR